MQHFAECGPIDGVWQRFIIGYSLVNYNQLIWNERVVYKSTELRHFCHRASCMSINLATLAEYFYCRQAAAEDAKANIVSRLLHISLWLTQTSARTLHILTLLGGLCYELVCISQERYDPMIETAVV